MQFTGPRRDVICASCFVGRVVGYVSLGWFLTILRAIQCLGTPLSKLLRTASPEAVDLITSMCAWDPSRRPTPMEALQHPYLQVKLITFSSVAAQMPRMLQGSANAITQCPQLGPVGVFSVEEPTPDIPSHQLCKNIPCPRFLNGKLAWFVWACPLC
jgi:hypothetical protein